MKRFVMRRLMTVMCTAGMLGVSSHALASAFQLWEQDGASIANYHAGYAVVPYNASIAFYNPAGITLFKNQQISAGGVGIMSDFKYQGSVTVMEGAPPILFTKTYNNVTAQGGNFSFVPNLSYVTPLTDKMGFGFTVNVPFGLKTNYGSSTPLRYAATLTSITVVDISPSLGLDVTDKASVGVGVDVQRAYAEFNNVGTSLLVPFNELTDTTSTNKANDTGYGYHLGALYKFTPDTQAGISYHSQVVHHLSGTSRFQGPIVDSLPGGPISSSHATANISLPAYTALSLYHRVNPQMAIMGSAIYTQWNSFRNLVLNGVTGAVLSPFTLVAASGNIQVVIPESYRNAWNLSLGTDYYLTDRITLRAGVGYDQTPVVNRNRNVQLPDNDRYIIALGGHYQASKVIGVDLGWMHLFIPQANINPPAQVMGAQVVTTNGHVTGGADVIGGQLTWDIV